MLAPRSSSFSLVAFLLFGAVTYTPLHAEDAGKSLESVAPQVSSEDSAIANFHSLGGIAGRTNIVRCANPVGPIVERLKGQEPTDADRQEAKARMQHLYDLGVRTVVSLQNQEPSTDSAKNPEYVEVILEKTAAQEVGLTYVAYSLTNKGKGKKSLQYMSPEDAGKLLETISNDIVSRSESGGVAFHCKSGKDRTGLLAAYLRVKYQNWTVDDALVEMRKRGHVWKKFLKPNSTLSWHEQLLQSIAETATVKQ